jgi:hypothetical protein
MMGAGKGLKGKGGGGLFSIDDDDEDDKPSFMSNNYGGSSKPLAPQKSKVANFLDEDDDDEGFIPKIKAPTAPPSLPTMPGANKGLPMPPAPMSKPNLPPPPTMPPVAAPKKAAAMWGAGDDDDDEDVGFAPKPKT